MVSNGNGNVKSNGKALELLGAPFWYIEGERRNEERDNRLEVRVTTLEKAVISGATKAGTKAGQRWGSFLGALIAVLTTTLMNQCYGLPPATPPTIGHVP